MERGTGRGDDFGFGDPFGSFGGVRRSRSLSLMSSLFGGKDPFDDPFFTHPFGNMMQPARFFGPSMLNPEINHFGQANNTEFLEEQRCCRNSSKGPVIQELPSDDENDNRETADGKSAESKEPSRSRSTNRPYVQHPDEATAENTRNNVQRKNEYRQSRHPSRSFSFQSSTVTYGGVNGAYYTASTRKTSGDGVMVEESKEADTTTGKASHRISKGIHDKGHSVTRKLNSDGKVDTLQTLHNLNEDELAGFENAWTGQARQHLPGWSPGPDMLGNERLRGSRVEEPSSSMGWALPSASKSGNSERRRTTIPIEFV